MTIPDPSSPTRGILAAGLSLFPPAAGEEERLAFREHLISSVWGGIAAGIVLLTDVILAKTLGAPGWQVTLLATLGPAANLFSFYWAGMVQGRRKAAAFLLAVVLGRLPLAILLLWPTSACMIAINFLYAVATALVLTGTNAIYQLRYPEPTRALRFGLATSVAAVFSILAAQVAGWLLERNETVFPWLFALAGLAGLLSAYHLYRMERTLTEPRDPWSWIQIGAASVRRRLRLPPEKALGLVSSVSLARKIFRENREFVRFERNFMIYGFAFLSVLPVLPLYIVHDLKMNYHQLSATKGLWAQIGLVVASPLLAIALTRLRPLRFTGRVFLFLSLYPICLLVSTLPGIGERIGWVYAALLFYSVAMAGVNLSWTLGSMHFAGNEDASTFQGLHVAMTGVRGLLAPSFGYAVHAWFGPSAVFALSAGLFLLAGILMLRQDLDARRTEVPAQPGPEP